MHTHMHAYMHIYIHACICTYVLWKKDSYPYP
jgi:hypothetical protein